MFVSSLESWMITYVGHLFQMTHFRTEELKYTYCYTISMYICTVNLIEYLLLWITNFFFPLLVMVSTSGFLNQDQAGLIAGKRSRWTANHKAGVQILRVTCLRYAWSRSSRSTPSSSTTCGWWSESLPSSYASSGSRATCASAPLPSEPSSGAHVWLFLL